MTGLKIDTPYKTIKVNSGSNNLSSVKQSNLYFLENKSSLPIVTPTLTQSQIPLVSIKEASDKFSDIKLANEESSSVQNKNHAKLTLLLGAGFVISTFALLMVLPIGLSPLVISGLTIAGNAALSGITSAFESTTAFLLSPFS